MRRREYLKDVMGGIASYPATSTVTAVAAATSLDGSAPGSPTIPDEYMQDPGFQNWLESIYRDELDDFSAERPNVLLDVIPVGNNYLEPGIAEFLEEEHRKNGINMLVGQREDHFPGDKFLEKYGWDAGEILGHGSYSGFVDKEVSSEMQEAAIQVIMAPGKPVDPEGFLEYEDTYNLGWTSMDRQRNSIVIASNTAFGRDTSREPAGYGENYLDGKLRVNLHEVGHLYGLSHEEGNTADVMHDPVYPDCNPSFSDGDWRRIRNVLD